MHAHHVHFAVAQSPSLVRSSTWDIVELDRKADPPVAFAVNTPLSHFTSNLKVGSTELLDKISEDFPITQSSPNPLLLTCAAP